MKKLLLTAAGLGAALAAIIVYYEHKNGQPNRIANAAGNAYKLMNDGIASVERPAHHTMG